jgi:hypothetical protein
MNTKLNKIQLAALSKQEQASQQIKLGSECYEGYLYKIFAIR